MAGNTDGIPAERLLTGERFSHEYAAVERELSRRRNLRVIVVIQ